MRIKKYENWKLNNFNHQLNNQLNKSNLEQESFSISQLLETPKKPSTKQNEQIFINEKHYSLTNPQAATNLNHRLLQKTEIYLHNNNTNTKNMNIFRTQQKSEREEIIKHKIKERIKEEFVNDSFNISTNRTFFNGNNNNNEVSFSYSNRKGDFMGLSFDERVGRGFDNNNDANVHVKGESLPINNSFTHKRSKSTVIRSGLVTASSQKHKQMFKPENLANKDNNSKKRIYSVEMKRQNSHNLSLKEKIYSKIENIGNKIYLKDIEPWEFDAVVHDGFEL